MTQVQVFVSHRRASADLRDRVLRRGLAAAGLIVLALAALMFGRLVPAAVERMATGPVRDALPAQLQALHAPADVIGFYAARDEAPLWIEASGVWPFHSQMRLRPEALQVAAGDPQLTAVLAAARTGRPADLARAEAQLSLALAAHVQDLSRAETAGLAFVDPELALPAGAGAALQQTAAAPSLAARVGQLYEVNPIYSGLLRGLAAYRATWGRLPQVQIPAGATLKAGDAGARVRLLRQRLGLAPGDRFDAALAKALQRFQGAHGLPPNGQGDPPTVAALNAGASRYEQLIAANLQRARPLPPLFGRRYVLVDVPAQQLWFYEDGQPKGAMKVVVGTRDEATPTMAGLMRYLVFNPYWNVPVDLVRTAIAPKVLKHGPSYFTAQHLQALTDWSDAADELAPDQVDWRAVASGELELRVRQRPGGDNMMGQVKFMLPNELGIYLHDTPEKALFARPQRLASAGCVRLERAEALAAWLLGRPSPNPATLGPDERVDLDQPTPVYIAYLTAAPGPDGVVFYPDVYGRDAPAKRKAG